jgi:carbon monoxide dehydrogenase subunit G
LEEGLFRFHRGFEGSIMLHLQGSQDFAKPVAEVWAKLSDARLLAPCIPGVETIKQADADTAVCVIRPGFTFIRGTLELTLRVRERVPDSLVRLQMNGKGIGSTTEVTAVLNFQPREGGSRVEWTADVTLGGLLRAVPSGLIQAAAQKVIGDAWAAIAAKMNE